MITFREYLSESPNTKTQKTYDDAMHRDRIGSDRRKGGMAPNKGLAGSDRRKNFNPDSTPAVQRQTGKLSRRKVDKK